MQNIKVNLQRRKKLIDRSTKPFSVNICLVKNDKKDRQAKYNILTVCSLVNGFLMQKKSTNLNSNQEIHGSPIPFPKDGHCELLSSFLSYKKRLTPGKNKL